MAMPDLPQTQARVFHWKCFAFGWVPAWALAIFLASAAIAAAGLSPLANGQSFGAGMFAVADEVSPMAKLGFGLIFGGLALAARKLLRLERAMLRLADILAAITAQLLALALIPADWSRGYGIGLTGERFATETLPIYLAAALVAGSLVTLAEGSCLSNRRALGKVTD
ncbi:hypothetical protein [Qipengyuania marisflavi]|uniref:Uncharacterized protein n=1 Tax=Qipengyuania marisflavi TaxID=2486356 RepID=A0A5S3P6S3_9SPHN|nr:hypothetical protein [Qipengyuania marisflavi]TMM48825.1 hypothetical protein FEV51_05370 [Qipengyuania marisflavi]